MKLSINKFLKMLPSTGWALKDGEVRRKRGLKVNGLPAQICPIAYVYWKVTGEKVRSGGYLGAGRRIGLSEEDCTALACAADGCEYVPACESVRKKLLKACGLGKGE